MPVYFFILVITSMLTACGGSASPATQVTGTVVIDDPLDTYDSGYWYQADGYANPSPFLNGWCASQVSYPAGVMQLSLEKTTCAGRTFASGHYQSTDFYSNIRVEARIKALSQSGTITSLFTYTGPSDGNPHDEVDIEIFGKDPTTMQVNFWVNEVEHPAIIDLGFDASADFHTYAFEWRDNTISWYVDDVLVYSVDSSQTTLPSTPGRVMMNLWACDNSSAGVIAWCGNFDTSLIGPVSAEYDWVKVTQF